ncbi:MAG: TATA-box-binding protein [Candidatus Aenigmarchaeota archaeon]|nr:TATA-box-binding protein [Candidatus Aenigmarchaeota archaeon]MBU5689028.1 TATA-box-binding protein [Candidatus Aenigmarchaeota archaeon]
MAKFDIKIENIVASASLGVRVPLEKMIKHLEGTEYEPEQFPGLVYRVKEPKAATLIFSSGKVVCTGARSIEDVKRVIKKVIDAIKSAGLGNPTKYTVQIENIVASAKLKSSLNLDKIAFEVEESEYEPEQFPGLVLRMRNPKVAFLLFSSGKIVCTGARKIKDVEAAVEMLSNKLKSIGAINE